MRSWGRCVKLKLALFLKERTQAQSSSSREACLNSACRKKGKSTNILDISLLHTLTPLSMPGLCRGQASICGMIRQCYKSHNFPIKITKKRFATIPCDTFLFLVSNCACNWRSCKTLRAAVNPNNGKISYFNAHMDKTFPVCWIYKFDSFLSSMKFIVSIIVACFVLKKINWWFRAFFCCITEGWLP